MGGNALFNPVLTDGGTLYIDDGRPMPGLIDETLRNLREISPTYYANVPGGLRRAGGGDGEGRRAVPQLLQESRFDGLWRRAAARRSL